MPPLADRNAIRRILETDRAWSLYALGDLEPGYFEHCAWFVSKSGEPALLLLYRAFETPVLFASGPAASLLDELPAREFYLHVRPEMLEAIAKSRQIRNRKEMWRMILDPARYRPASTAGVERLGPADLERVQALYADGASAGEAPDFFFPAMLGQVFFGIRERAELVSVAGTHLVAPGESVAAVGNVYTRRDRRGRGLAARLTSAVVDELRQAGIRTIGLNVAPANRAATDLYDRLGFARYCAFFEGLAG